MKVGSFVLFMFMASSLFAANIQWDCFTQRNYDYDDETVYSFDYFGYMEDFPGVTTPFPNVMPSVGITTSKNGAKVTLDGSMGNYVLAFVGVWLEKHYGDLIDETTMSGQSDYFAAFGNLAVSGESYSKTIEANVNDTVYLALMETTGNTGFGWIELYVENDGELTLVHSAYDVDGSPMIVGGGSAIPEPTSLSLLIIGCSMIFLRRKSFVHGIHKETHLQSRALNRPRIDA